MSLNKSFPASIEKITFENLAAVVTIEENEHVKEVEVEIISEKHEKNMVFDATDRNLVIRCKGETNNKYNMSGNNVVININGGNIQFGGNIVSTSTFGGKDEIKINIQVPPSCLNEIHNRAAADLNIKGITRDLRLTVSGQGDIQVVDVNNIDLTVSGQGDVSIEDAVSVRGRISGQGDFSIKSAQKMKVVDISISGMGDIDVHSDIDSLRLHISGMGDVNVRGTIGTKDVHNSGMGSVRYRN